MGNNTQQNATKSGAPVVPPAIATKEIETLTFDVERFGSVPVPIAERSPGLANRLAGVREAVLRGEMGERTNFPEYKALTRDERNELMRYGWTFDVDRMGKPTIGLSDDRKIEFRRWQMAEKRKASALAEPETKEGE